MISDQLWEQWIALQKRILQLAARKEYDRVAQELAGFLLQQDEPTLKSEILALSGDLKEKQGKLEEAKEDFLAAQALSAPASYQRYTLELMLADLYKKTQDSKGSIFWYGKALETVAEDPLTSGSAAIAGLVEQKGFTELSADEKALCERALKQAWKLFSLPGQPELENLHAAIGVLDEASTRPLPGK